GRIPLFREFARLLAGGTGPVNWELARQVAVATAAGADALGTTPELPTPSQAPPASEQREWDDRLRLAELWVEPATTLAGHGLTLTARPVSRPDWAETVLPGFAPLVEPGARRVSEALGSGTVAGMPAEMGDVMGRLGSLLTGLQVGTLVGQLARLVLAQYDLALPAADAGRVLVLAENVREFEQASGLPADQFRLWLACHEVVRQRLLCGVPWMADHLRGVVDEIARQTEPDASGLMDRLQSLDLGRLESLQEVLEGDQDVLGPASPGLQAAIGRLEILLALTEGYADVICARALAGRLPALAAIEAALGRRLADLEGAHAQFAQLLRADPGRSAAANGQRFCREVLAATDIDGLDRLWAHPDFLPTPEELAVPGRWLERSGLVGGDEVDLDEGLRALLEGEPGPGGDDARGTGDGADGAEGSPGR
ncbi:MAG TPA: zinc-dependent metalloprotease, partial [Actinomycetota bacterium]|nr:zinc-dependent metalloprotease [Actinomycetota bacterium]